MNLSAFLLVFLLFVFSPITVVHGGRARCQREAQCGVEEVCDDGYCMTVDEMFKKYGKMVKTG